MSDPNLEAAVQDVQCALEGYTEDCLTSDPKARWELDASWGIIKKRLEVLGRLQPAAVIAAARMDDLNSRLPEFYQGALAADARALREAATTV